MGPCPRHDIVTVFPPLSSGLRPPAERVSRHILPARSSSLPQVFSVGHRGQTKPRHDLHIANETEHWAMLNHRLVRPVDQSCQAWLVHCQRCTCQGGRKGKTPHPVPIQILSQRLEPLSPPAPESIMAGGTQGCTCQQESSKCDSLL